MQKGNALLVILLVTVLLVGASGYYLFTKGYFGENPNAKLQTTNIFDYGSTPLTTSQSASSQEVGDVSSGKIDLTILSPTNDSTLTSTAVTVKGKTSANADVFINDQETKADANGNFSLTMTLDEGQNGLVIIANDADGNVAEKDISVNIQSF